MLDAVKIPAAAERIDSYPHEFSGGMRQRVTIAMALVCNPDLVIADEPTTSVDTTVQAAILALLGELRRELNMSIILISHDFDVVAGLCERVLVMYAGEAMEYGPIDTILHRPRHPYTQGLLRSMPRLDDPIAAKLATIPGAPPSLLDLPPGCPFYPRCAERLNKCRTVHPELRAVGPRHIKACHLPDNRGQRM
jgi:oligopeptide transport system ATP-binding protein